MFISEIFLHIVIEQDAGVDKGMIICYPRKTYQSIIYLKVTWYPRGKF